MFIWIVIMVLAVFFDQLTKYLTVLLIKPAGSIPIIEDVVHLTYVENTGAAFGMMKNQRWLFMVVSSIAIIALLVYLFKKKSKSRLENWAIALIVGGGIGNMIDRVVLGYVVDMIDFRLINFAVFNVADSFVCIGAGLLMLHIILLGVKEYKEEKARKLALAKSIEEEMADIEFRKAKVDPLEAASDVVSEETMDPADHEAADADVSMTADATDEVSLETSREAPSEASPHEAEDEAHE